MAGKPLTKKRRGRGEGTAEPRGVGRWRLRVYLGTVNGKPIQVSRTVVATNRSEALKLLRQFTHEIDAGTVTLGGGPRQPFAGLLDKWIAHIESRGRAATTLASYRTISDTHLKPALGHIALSRLTAYDLDDYYQARLKAGMAARTVRLHHSIISAALTQAVKWGWVNTNVAERAEPPAVPRDKKVIPAVDQVKVLLDAAASDVELAAAVALAAVTGARRSELCGLRWSDVDWVAGTLRVERQRVPLKGGNRTVPLKHGEGRTVTLGVLGLEIVTRYRAEVQARAARSAVPADPDGWLLSRDGGHTPLRSQWLGESITGLGKRTGIPVTTHAFRRFAATQMIGGGVDVRTAAGRLGHTPEMLLRVYAGFLPARDQAAAELLGGLLVDSSQQ